MTLTEKIDQDIKSAMLAKEKDKLEALRAVKAALLVMKTQEAGVIITEDMEMKLLQKMAKSRRETAEIYKTQNRSDLEVVEIYQANVIEEYLPKQMSYAEIKFALMNIIMNLDHTPTIKDMGYIMKEANQVMSGKADSKVIAGIVKVLI
jgi:uncharacterized protein YqeY